MERVWSDGDTVEWILPLETQLIAVHPLIRSDAGKAAIQRGPLVYCLEQVDNGSPLSSLSFADPSNPLLFMGQSTSQRNECLDSYLIQNSYVTPHN